MHHGNYRFICRFESEAHLPAYKGSTFRGVFGRSLKQVVCALKRQDCPTCLLKGECLYPAVFEPQLAACSDDATRRGGSPHPYVVEPPLDTGTAYVQGDLFDFNLLLFGEVNQRLPYFIYAFDRMGRIGIGKKVDGRRAAFRLESVEALGEKIYHHSGQRLLKADAYRDLVPVFTEGRRNADSITLDFETPLRLKHNNRLATELPFHLLVRAMLRRTSTLLRQYDGGEPNLDYSGMVRRAESIRTVETTLVWEDWRRYSNRQEQAMMMGGLKGTVSYAGDLGEFLPLIDFCSRVHLGKQTTFGLGKFSVEANP